MAVKIHGSMAKIVFALCFILITSVSTTTWSDGERKPIQVIQAGTDKALEILHSLQTGKNPSLKQRRAEILDIVDDYFNFMEMAKRALGRPWKDQAPDKQQEFVQLFKQLLFNTYVDKVETYTMGDEKVVYDSEEIRDKYALVKTRVLNYKNTNVEVDYYLRLEEGQWKVYDIIVEGISLVNNYRSQFSSILTNKTFDQLLDMLRDRAAQQTGGTL